MPAGPIVILSHIFVFSQKDFHPDPREAAHDILGESQGRAVVQTLLPDGFAPLKIIDRRAVEKHCRRVQRQVGQKIFHSSLNPAGGHRKPPALCDKLQNSVPIFRAQPALGIQ